MPKKRGFQLKANSDDQQQSTPAGEAKRARKPYVKPEVKYERVFETLALTCGKVGVTQFTCHAARKAS